MRADIGTAVDVAGGWTVHPIEIEYNGVSSRVAEGQALRSHGNRIFTVPIPADVARMRFVRKMREELTVCALLGRFFRAGMLP
ncbi:hypothetical protein GCM10025857_35690 [Alicyclobacillus contaminans]|nr:hypothetical protein GCM10025857_35690 [Alicyclobacillus contaminans]